MSCCRKPRTSSPLGASSPVPETTKKERIILKIPGASAHLLEQEGSVELARGDLSVLRLIDEELVLATVIKIGSDLQWPLARDEPVVKMDEMHYLFSLPDRDGMFLNYGVSFSEKGGRLDSFDAFLRENSCFSINSGRKPSSSKEGYWCDYLRSIGDYNKVLEKAICGGTGRIVEGIYAYTDAYNRQVQKGVSLLQPHETDETNRIPSKNVGNNAMNKSIRRVRKISEMTEKMSKSMLNGVVTVTGTLGAPIAKSKAGKAVLGSFPGSVLISSLDAINKVLDAVETAEKKTLASTGGAVARVVTKRFGENAGQATEDVFATAGHTVGTAWNCFKIRKAITPSSSVSSSILKNAVRKKT